MVRKRVMRDSTFHLDEALRKELGSVKSIMSVLELSIEENKYLFLEEKDSMFSRIKIFKTQITKVINGELKFDDWKKEFTVLFNEFLLHSAEILNKGGKKYI